MEMALAMAVMVIQVFLKMAEAQQLYRRTVDQAVADWPTC